MKRAAENQDYPKSNKVKQTCLENYFSCTQPTSRKHKKCFIYDPQNASAFFDHDAASGDSFVCAKSAVGIRLYYRPTAITTQISDVICKLRPISTNTALLKSNLQKAIRRGLKSVALYSAWAILQQSPVELLRRLPIICIEDVSLVQSISIPVWLMMAEKEHKIDATDTVLLLSLVATLAACSVAYLSKNMPTQLPPSTPIDLENHPTHSSALLALHYRSLYGGMKGDMDMLRTAISFYNSSTASSTSEAALVPCSMAEIERSLSSAEGARILPAAIDFHCFPQMVDTLAKETGQDETVVKEMIWVVESGVNFRKEWTVQSSRDTARSPPWQMLVEPLRRLRSHLVR